MVKRGRPLRGLADLRTLGGRSDQRIPAHKAYLRISFLELERARRTLEMQTANDRIETIRARFQEIDAEIAGILDRLDGTPPPRPASPPARTAPARRGAGNFRLSY